MMIMIDRLARDFSDGQDLSDRLQRLYQARTVVKTESGQNRIFFERGSVKAEWSGRKVFKTEIKRKLVTTEVVNTESSQKRKWCKEKVVETESGQIRKWSN